MDIKENLSQNLIQYRKSMGLTQAELAEKLNYSDKAVSKWERGESFPDLYVLKQIADFYEVSIDTLIDKPKQIKNGKNQPFARTKQIIIALCSVGITWLVAVCCSTFLDIIFENLTETWLSFIYAIPVSFIILVVFSAIWRRHVSTAVHISCLVWSSILAVYLSCVVLIENAPDKLWELFLIGIPLQLLVVFWSIYRKIKRGQK